jgi:hypothetical protein
MGNGIIKKLISGFEKVCEGVADARGVCNALTYTVTDALKSALAVFYLLHPSLLNFQQEMKKKMKRCNLETLFKVKKIPCTVQIKNIVDNIDPAGLSGAFKESIMEAERRGIINDYRVLNKGVLIPLDGVWYFSSKEVSCGHCLTITKKNKDGEEETTYYHDAVTAAIVKPNCPVVLPLMPEFIRNGDGKEKQDCERNAGKRYFDTHGEWLKWLAPTFLGDDLYCCHDICKKILDLGMNFIFTCKPETHKWVAEQVKYGDETTFTRKEWTGNYHLVYQYKWVNGIENRMDGGKLTVNYLSLEIKNKETGGIEYSNTWMTSHKISLENARLLGDCARCRWKIENEHNNVLKHRGYNLKHNFGHGKNHAAEVFCLLILLSFLFHGIQEWADEEYKKARAYYGRRDAFFWALRTLMSLYLFENWRDFFLTTAGEPPGG